MLDGVIIVFSKKVGVGDHYCLVYYTSKQTDSPMGQLAMACRYFHSRNAETFVHTLEQVFT